jgi:uncharacterized membrane-anchored protein
VPVVSDDVLPQDAAAAAPAPTTVTGTARVGRRAPELLARVRRGDVAVLDHTDLDARSAEALVAAGVAAVVNAGPLLSARFPGAGPQVLAQAGVLLVDQVGEEALAQVRDGRPVRIEDTVLLVADREVGSGRRLGLEAVHDEMRRARTGLAAHLDTFAANAADFLSREQDLVLDGAGLPAVRTQIAGRAVVVVGRAGDHEAELRSVRRFVREQDPVLIAIDRAADDLAAVGLVPHVVVVPSDDPAAVPSMDRLREATDVVVRVGRGDHPGMLESLSSLGAEPLRCETSATTEDVALLIAGRSRPDLVVGVGLHADLAELLDHRRSALASTWLTRVSLGPALVDAASLPLLYTGRTRTWHVLVVLLAGWLALAAALATTPVGQDWFDHIADLLQGLFS